MATHEVEVDWSRTLVEQPETGHNRWHPDIPPVVRCDPGDEVVLPTRDAFDGQMGPAATLDTVRAPNLNVVHPLTGPVYVNGAENGDILEVEILHVEPDRYGYTVQVPGFGFLRDQFPEPFMVRWSIADGWASSDDLPGVRVPGAPFMGHHRARSRPAPARGDHRPRAGGARPGRLRAPARPDRRRAGGGHRARGPAHGPTKGDRGERGHQAAQRRHPPVHPGVRAGRPVLGGRRPLRPRGLRRATARTVRRTSPSPPATPC